MVRACGPATSSQKVVGLFASFVFARRIGRGVYDDVQLFFAERRQAAGKPLAVYHRLVPTFVARYNGMSPPAAPVERRATPWPAGGWILLGSIPLGLGLAAFGYYVLAYIATGKA